MSDVNVPVALGERSYTIHMGSGLLSRAKDVLPDLAERQIFILHDEAVQKWVDSLKAGLNRADAPSLALKGGEKTKSWENITAVTDWLLSHKVNRQAVLFVVGGGVLGDLGGFAASVTLRGIDFVQIPTTLLAQVDSSVGGKTGINTSHGKNLVGSFYQPVAVLCDTDTLSTLSDREMQAGYAEIVKYGLLGDRAFYEWLEKHGNDVLSRSPEVLTYAIETSCRMKAAIVGDDERERKGGRRALLNLGHTFAHALEAAAKFDGRLLHGEAVSIGLVLAYRLSARTGLCSMEDAMSVKSHLKKCGLKTEIAQITPRLNESAGDIIAHMAHDKKASGNKIGFILARNIGDAFQTSDIEIADVRAVIEESIAAS